MNHLNLLRIISCNPCIIPAVTTIPIPKISVLSQGAYLTRGYGNKKPQGGLVRGIKGVSFFTCSFGSGWLVHSWLSGWILDLWTWLDWGGEARKKGREIHKQYPSKGSVMSRHQTSNHIPHNHKMKDTIMKNSIADQTVINASLPAQFKKLPNWVNWKRKDRENGKTDKIPINPITGRNASATNPATWSDIETATTALFKSPSLAGIGIVLTAEVNLCCIDLDDVLAADPSPDNSTQRKFVNQAASDLFEKFRPISTWEFSQSGKGLHLFVKVANSSQFEDCRKKLNYTSSDSIVAAEVYFKDRFIALGGEPFSTGEDFGVPADAQLLELLFVPLTAPTVDVGNSGGSNASPAAKSPPARSDSPPTEWKPGEGNGPDPRWIPPSSGEPLDHILHFLKIRSGKKPTINEMFGEEKSPKFFDMFFNTPVMIDNYGSDSEGDMAFFSWLAFICGRDVDLVHEICTGEAFTLKFEKELGRLFPKHALEAGLLPRWRDKWKRNDYLLGSILKAAMSCQKVYTGSVTDKGKIAARSNDERDFDMPLTLEEMGKNLVFISEGNRVGDARTGDVCSFASASRIYAPEFMKWANNALAQKRVAHREILDFSSTDAVVRNPVFANKRLFNRFRGFNHRGSNFKQAHVDIFFSHVDYLFPIEAERKVFLQWFIHMIQHPEQKPKFGVFMNSKTQGIGKGLLGKMIEEAVTGEYSETEMDINKTLLGGFNNRMASALFVSFSETAAPRSQQKSFEMAEGLKAMITDETMTLNIKGGSQQKILNPARILGGSNHVDAIPYTAQDRRIFLVAGPEEIRPRSYYDAIGKALDDADFGYSLFTWAKGQDNSAFNHNRHAPRTKAHAKGLEAQMSPIGVALEEFLEFWEFSIFKKVDAQHYVRICLNINLNTRDLGDMLRELNALGLDTAVVKIMPESGKETETAKNMRFWIKDGDYKEMAPAQRRAGYDAQHSKLIQWMQKNELRAVLDKNTPAVTELFNGPSTPPSNNTQPTKLSSMVLAPGVLRPPPSMPNQVQQPQSGGDVQVEPVLPPTATTTQKQQY